MHRLLFTFIMALAMPAHAARGIGSEEIPEREITRALKDALSVSADKAVARLGREDGFLLNEKVRIPLPEGLSRMAASLRRIGMGRYPDELVVAMNRAAESAVPEARALLVDAISRMRIADGRQVISGGDESATRYFRRQTEAAMAARFLPVVRAATRRLHVADAYNQAAGRAAKVGLLRLEDSNLDEYITRKALDGVYSAMAEEERAIRAHPMQQTQKTLRKVFGAL